MTWQKKRDEAAEEYYRKATIYFTDMEPESLSGKHYYKRGYEEGRREGIRESAHRCHNLSKQNEEDAEIYGYCDDPAVFGLAALEILKLLEDE